MQKRFFFCALICVALICQSFGAISVQASTSVTLANSTEILAVNNTSVEPTDQIVQAEHWITGEQSMQIKGDYGADRKINFLVNADDAGVYNFAIRCSVWRNSTTDNPELSVLVDGTSVGKVMIPYDGNAVRPSKLLDSCTVGTYELSKGQHTVSISTNWGCDSWVQSIIISKTGIKVEDKKIGVGDSLTVDYEFLPADNTADDLVWESDDESICSVNDGVITGVAAGETTITVKSESKPSVKGKFKVTVTVPNVGKPYGGKAVTISDEESAVIYAAKKNVESESDDGVIYSTEDGSVFDEVVESKIESLNIRAESVGDYWYYTVDVKKAGKYKIDILGTSGYTNSSNDGGGRFTLKLGSVDIADTSFKLPSYSDTKAYYQFTDNDKVTIGEFRLESGVQTIKITVPQLPSNGEIQFRKMWFTYIPSLEEIKVKNQNITVGKGKTVELEYSLLPKNVKVDDLEWESSDTSVCTVEDGKVTGVSKGTAKVTLSSESYPGIVGEWNINVLVDAAEVTLSKTELSLKVGKSEKLTATVSPDDADDKTVVWQSSNREVASVKNGVVTAKGVGTAEITATCGDVVGSATVKVTSAKEGGSYSGPGGGSKYVPPVYETKNDTSNSEILISGDNISALKSEELAKLFGNADAVTYKMGTDNFSAEILGEFFTKNPASKSFVYKLNNATVEIGADALNKQNPNDDSKISVSAKADGNSVTLNISIDDKAIEDLNEGVKVIIPSAKDGEYVVTYGGKEVSSKVVDGSLVFEADKSGTYLLNRNQSGYSDLNSVLWAKDDILTAMEKDWLKPVGKNLFGANNEITRAEFVSAVVKALNLTAESEEEFKDVSKDSEYYKEIITAKALDVINGVDGVNFEPNSPITRQDMAVVVYKALAYENTESATREYFKDDDLIADYAKDAVYSLAGRGILKGSEVGFNPLGNTTRAETAVLLMRIAK